MESLADRGPAQKHTGSGWRLQILPGGIGGRLLLLIVLAMLPLLLLLGWITYQRYETRRIEALQTEVEVARGIATTFAAYVEGVHQQSYAVGQAIVTDTSYSADDTTHLLTAAAAHFPAVRNLSWTSPSGLVLTSSLTDIVGHDLSFRPYFLQILSGQPWAIGDLMPSGVINQVPTLAIATAIRDEQGTLRGVIVAGIEPTRLGELVLTQQRPASGAYSIFDRQGIVVYNSQGASLTWEQRVDWQTSDPVLMQVFRTGQEQVGVVHLAIPGGEWVSARVPIPGLDWVAGARRPVAVALAPVQRSLIEEGLIALAVWGVALFLALRIARTISQPLHRLEQDAQRMGTGIVDRLQDSQAPNEVRRLRSTVEDMATALIQRAEALLRSQTLLSEAEKLSHTGAWEWDLKNNQWTFSEEWLEIHGCPRRALTPEELLLIAHPDDRAIVQQSFEQVSKGVRPYNLEHRIIRQDTGAIRVMKARGQYIRDASGGIVRVYGFAQDITERKQAEQALAAYAQKLERQNRELQDFAYITSHDLQEPLRKIETFLDLFLTESAPLNQPQQELIERIQNGVSRMRKMLNGLLQLACLTAQTPMFEPVDVGRVMSDVLSDLKLQIQNRDAQMILHDLPVLEVDPTQMRQILKNLVENALKFQTPGARPLVQITARHLTPGQVEITVADNGIGFQMEHAEKLFQPFQRLVGRNDYEGVGMGLAICHKIAELHNGTIAARSSAGQGASFIVTLPIHQNTTEEQRGKPADENQTDLVGGRG